MSSFMCRLMVVAGLGVPVPVLAQPVTVTGAVVLEGETQGANTKTDYSDVVVWLMPTTLADSPVGPTPGRFEIRQKDKRFTPRILPLPAGSTVDFPNLDGFFHNVFSMFEGKRFDLGLYEAGTSRSTQFGRAGVSYVFCNIHPEMVAVVVAVETDLFARTDVDGRFRIEGVPNGEYQLHVWHERMQSTDGMDNGRHLSVAAADVQLPPILVATGISALEGHANKYGQEYDVPTASGVPYLLPE